MAEGAGEEQIEKRGGGARLRLFAFAPSNKADPELLFDLLCLPSLPPPLAEG